MKLSLRNLALCYNPWLIAAWITTGCVLSPGVDIPLKEDPDGGINAGDGDGDDNGDGDGDWAGGLGGACQLGGAGGHAGSDNSAEKASDANERLAPPPGGAPGLPSCVVR